MSREKPVKQNFSGVLSADRMAELESQAETQAIAEIQKEAEKQFLSDLVAQKKRELAGIPDEPGEDVEIEEVHIDLAPHADRITLDGKVYFHGNTYKMTLAQAATVKEIIGRSWMHEAEIGGANTNAMYGRRPSNTVLRPH